jgi:hypothetical protein
VVERPSDPVSAFIEFLSNFFPLTRDSRSELPGPSRKTLISTNVEGSPDGMALTLEFDIDGEATILIAADVLRDILSSPDDWDDTAVSIASRLDEECTRQRPPFRVEF